MGSDRSRVTVGRIVGTHGIKGSLKLKPLTDYPERFLHMETLYLELPQVKGRHRPPRELKILDVRFQDGKDLFIVTLEGIDTIEMAEDLKGALITVAPEDRVPLEEGVYWIDDIIGLEVVEDETDAVLGVVEDVMPTGSNDVYEVRTPDGVLKMIPATGEVIRKVDLEARQIRVHLLEGLWD
ncbi:ribosome maturation factor RimM [Thermanaerovibrio acidaminovorans]|uniref:ribosome maturation factor RimM n=1 Tax=Thermanaerovibrio acidaminovorans TaxID=81462 RepID=UPI00249358DA|nr:ribosome maturation factor RimM [Thermanaerovibrio acidaminovorans]